ncbi:GNAT family N-acetyltransferase [Nocardia mangyaensis]|uniref:GNAT family N-acetyltransferase n=1 Tax=Nocardia mangyaensis TaxID=2213200 RepID=A0A1J0VV52_9NOCA|nr:GNAT family N-acetyltransferase [Nocardia mangyaensis]APE35881.1 GNAT family N-acetyltransferase [Nocardia mangyaensis]
MSWIVLGHRVLENDHVRLQPISVGDREALHAVAMDPEIWRYFVTMIETRADFDEFFDACLDDDCEGRRVVYVITDKASGRVAGSMSLGNLAESDARLEIGWSWLGRDFRGAGLNRWAKLLLLEHAFETLGAHRVEFKTDQLNMRARSALRNIGATEEGTLRSFNFMPGGRRRDAVYYSILAVEWAPIRQVLMTHPKVEPAISSR